MIRIGKITGFTLIIPRFRPFANGYILIFLRFGLLALPLRQVLMQRKKYAKVNTRIIEICGDAGMIEIRYVQAKDKAFWYSLDKHLSEHEFYNKIRKKQGYVLLVDNQPVGLLRYHLLWDNTPFCAMLFIEPHNQKKGVRNFFVPFLMVFNHFFSISFPFKTSLTTLFPSVPELSVAVYVVRTQGLVELTNEPSVF